MSVSESAWVLFTQDAVAEKYYNLATCVLIIYDHILTFDMEVDRIWSQRWTFPKFLWFLFRYLTPIIQIGSVVEDLGTWTRDGCHGWILVRTIGDEIVTFATIGVMVLRIWALFKKARWAIIVMICTMLAQVGITIWAVQAISSTTTAVPGFRCAPIAKDGRTSQVATAYVGVFLMDAVVLLFSCLRIFKFYTKRKSTSEIISIMVRDGVIYFFIICIVNLANVLLVKVATPTLQPLNSEFTVNITVLLVSRLVLNLRSTETSTTPDELAAESTLVGNLGEPIIYSTPPIQIRVTTECVTYSDGIPDDRLELQHLRPVGKKMSLSD